MSVEKGKQVMKYELRKEQVEARDFLIENPQSLLLGDVGSGKTLVLLDMISRDLSKSWLVVAPRLVLYNAWIDKHLERFYEFRNWDYGVVHGPKWRDVYYEDHHIYLTTTDMVRTLASEDMSYFDGIVVDEIDKFKNPSAKRTRQLLRQVSKDIPIRIGATGTPATKSLEGLWSQVFFADQGKTLERTITAYRRKYFFRGGFGGYSYIPKRNALKDITAAMKPSTHRMERESEEPIMSVIDIELSPANRKLYAAAKRKAMIAFGDTEKLVGEAAAAYSTLRQISAGSFYDENKNWNVLHTEKLKALEDIYEQNQQKKILCFYWFKFEAEMIKDYFKGSKIAFLNSDTKPNEVSTILRKWAADELDFVFAQPASSGHGVDGLQVGASSIAWLTLPDDLGLYEQANGRIAGNRAERTITIYHLLTKNSVDGIIFDSLQNKSINQSEILKRLE
jgi:superfamily II DNA or RNA helicase